MSASTVPGTRQAANRSPMRAVSSGERDSLVQCGACFAEAAGAPDRRSDLSGLLAVRELADGIGNLIDHVAGDHARLSVRLRGEVSGQTM